MITTEKKVFSPFRVDYFPRSFIYVLTKNKKEKKRKLPNDHHNFLFVFKNSSLVLGENSSQAKKWQTSGVNKIGRIFKLENLKGAKEVGTNEEDGREE